MSENNAAKKIKEAPQKAWDKIAKDKLPAIPKIYELLYVFYCESDQDVLRAVGDLLAENSKLEEQQCLEVYDTYLSHLRQEQEVREASDTVQKAIKSASDTVDEVKTSTEKFGKTIKEKTQTLRLEQDPIKIKKAVEDVVETTDAMIKKNEELEKKLVDSSHMMEEMRANMERAQHEARTDALTGVANRKAFEQAMRNLINDYKSKGADFSLIMMDIDHFKNFNDSYGHTIGDQVLKLVASTLVSGVKGRDSVCRYGGEEFAIILPETGIAGGLKVAESLRMDVANKELINRTTGENLGTITLSGGVAEYVKNESAENMVERADSALYKAKRNGRNQISAALPHDND